MVEKHLYGSVLLKAKDILDFISNSEMSPTLKEISNGVEISKPTVLKILQTLEYCGFVRAVGPNKEYYLGTTFIKYGDKAANSFDLKKIAMPFLNKLRDSTTEAVNLGIVENNKIVLLDRAQSLNNIRLDLTLGGTMQMYTSAMGKAILSYYSDNELNEYIDHTALKPQTINTLTTREELLGDIQKIRQRGYAVDNIENQDGIYCIGFPIVKHDHIFGAFSISAPVFRVDDEKITNWIEQGKRTQQAILNQV
ncbi:IclR family transcriptional regulator [Lactobacillus sp. PSON]|uniref:IclR family transcriptional regulator n=1 Tax=Lactobacillus sp. PSON TaxID=3455454 RepID=UPI0040430AEF